MDRLIPWDLVRGHFKSLFANESALVRIVLTLVIHGAPLGAGIGVWFIGLDAKVLAPTLTAMSLLSGGTLSAFSHLSTLRLRLTERHKANSETEKPDRRMFDESATHLLMCAAGAMTTAASLVATMVLNPGATSISGLNAAWLAWISSLTFLLFWIAVPRIYLAYVVINSVDQDINGTVSGRIE